LQIDDEIMTYIYHHLSPLGPVTLASDGEALTGLWFDGQKYFGSMISQPVKEGCIPVFDETIQWLKIYFSGREPDFTPALCLHATPFRERVWQILLTIPFGQTMTYGEVAERVAYQQGGGAKSSQAVGSAVGHNPISLIIPCHRVVGAQGQLTGYAGGLGRKEWLLKMEGGNTMEEER